MLVNTTSTFLHLKVNIVNNITMVLINFYLLIFCVYKLYNISDLRLVGGIPWPFLRGMMSHYVKECPGICSIVRWICSCWCKRACPCSGSRQSHGQLSYNSQRSKDGIPHKHSTTLTHSRTFAAPNLPLGSATHSTLHCYSLLSAAPPSTPRVLHSSARPWRHLTNPNLTPSTLDVTIS